MTSKKDAPAAIAPAEAVAVTAPTETPAPVSTERPRSGGSYVRDRATGKLVKKEA